MTGNYSSGPVYYTMNPTAGQVVEMWNIPEGEEVYPATDVFAPQTTHLRSSFAPLTLARAMGQPLFFVADYAGAMTANLAVQYVSTLATPKYLGPLAGTVTETGATIETPHGSRYYTFSVSSPSVIYPKATAASGSTMTPVTYLYDATMNDVPLSAGLMMPTFVQVSGPTEFVLRVTDADGGGGASYSFDLTVTGAQVTPVEETEPNDAAAQATEGTGMPVVFLGTLGSGTDTDYFKFTLSAQANVVITILATGSPLPDTAIALYDATGTTELANNDDVDGLFCAFGFAEMCLSRIDQSNLAAGTYLVAVKTPYSAPGPYAVIIMTE